MNWYKKLTIEQKINLKELSESICGIRYTTLINLFGMRQTIELLHFKLQLENFD
jgi:hypothetical protein